MRRATLAILLMFALCSNAQATKIPELKGRVNDYANKLSADEKLRLETKLAAHEKESSNQVVILITPSLEGNEVSSYSYDVAKAWHIGQSGKNGGPKDNGVLVLWAPTERRVRIEVGYGLEGCLTDLGSSEIADAMALKFAAGKAYEGLDLGTSQIFESVKGEYKNTGATAKGSPQGKTSAKTIMCIVLIVVFFIVLILVLNWLFPDSGILSFLFTLLQVGLSMLSGSSESSGESFKGGGGKFGGGGANSDY